MGRSDPSMQKSRPSPTPKQWPGRCYDSLRMKRALAALGVFVALAGAIACGSLGSSDNLAGDKGASSSGGESPSAGSPGDLAPLDNGIILVHAAGAPSFRVCFSANLNALPAPDSVAMPQANVVGVEVGSAVRIAPLAAGPAPDSATAGQPGDIYMFEEPLIRTLYPANGGGPTCKALLSNPDYSKLAVKFSDIKANLSRGVHLLVFHGCTAKTALRTYTKEQCGPDYTDDKGNLALEEGEIRGTIRPTDRTVMPAQVIHLAQALEGTRKGRELRVSFGSITTENAPHDSAAVNPPLFQNAVDFKEAPKFNPDNTEVYGQVGFRVTLSAPPVADGGVDGGNDGGTSIATTQVILQQSLADIQALSAPRELPTTYYAAASNYVLLLLGDPALVDKPDSSAGDQFRGLHFLAVPVIDPNKGDGGADAAPDGS
jgi:hypothetical protein